MIKAEMTLNDVRSRGYAALLKELGPVGYVRFIQQFSAGKGDYTKERHTRLDHLSVEEIHGMILERRKHSPRGARPLR